MPQGFQVFDASGNVVVDVSTRLTRYLATARIAWNDFTLHTFTSPIFATGNTPFFLVDNHNNASSSIIHNTCLAGWMDIRFSGDMVTYQQILAEGVSLFNHSGSKNDIVIHFGVY